MNRFFVPKMRRDVIKLQRTIVRCGEVRSLAFTPDGTGLLATSSNCKLSLWDVHTGKVLRRYKDIAYRINDFKVLPEEDLLISVSTWDAARIWRFSDGELLALIFHMSAKDKDQAKEWLVATPGGDYEHSPGFRGEIRWADGRWRFIPGIGFGYDPKGSWRYDLVDNTAGEFVEDLLAKAVRGNDQDCDEVATGIHAHHKRDSGFDTPGKGAAERELIARNLPTTIGDEARKTFFAAAEEGDAEIVRLYLDLGMPTDTRREKDDATALHAAACNNHSDLCQTLIDRGADLEATNKTRETPLIAASNNQAHRAIQLLINAGANIHATDESGWMTLHNAAHFGDEPLAAMLLKAGASTEAETNDGLTPLAIALNQSAAVARKLIDAGANVNHRSEPSDWPYLVRMIVMQEIDNASWLLDAGAAPDAACPYGWTPWMAAVLLNQHELAERLLAAGATKSDELQVQLVATV